MSVRTSASTPSTSSSRRASASRPSPTWMHTRRSSPPRRRRRAAPRRRRRPVGKLVRKPSFATSSVLRLRERDPPQPGPDSAPAVLVVTLPPDTCLIAPLGCAVEPLVHAPEAVHTTRIGGIGVIDDAVLKHERTDARSLACVRSRVGSGHGRKCGGPVGCRTRGYVDDRRLAYVVVFDRSLALLLLSQRDVEVEVEVA